ncbi:hypothetical protein QTH97_34210 [Variovorax sp. J22R24]|uniref:hypothetical protein n=1 Tax=Variovorax gracilis TaxID=3053502 RepID=UPI002577A1C6|nr:hypothetical protein [Variovorax sp. J22R24]MDM0110004.1 hypothetical protein [Variovorax sp. J22R24]
MNSAREPGRQDDEEDPLDLIYDLFYPRRVWGTPAFASADPDDQRVVTALHALLAEETATLTYGLIHASRLEQKNWHATAEDTAIIRVVHERRGGPDIKLHTSSGYVHLKQRYPDSRIEAHEKVPIGYLERTSKTFVTAGNCAPARLMKYMLSESMLTLEMVGADPGLKKYEQYYSIPGFQVGDLICLATLTLSPDAAEFMRREIREGRGQIGSAS